MISHPCRSRQGKGSGGQLTKVYALSDVRKACADLLKPLPKAGKNGFFKADGEEWGCRRTIARLLGVHKQALSACVDKASHSCRSRQGKGSGGQLTKVYALSDVRKACADLLKPLPKAGKNGFFKADGEEWGHIKALAIRIGVGERGVFLRVGSCRTKTGRTQINREASFYALSDARKACADLLKSKRPSNVVSVEVLTSHAPVMARVLKTLREKHPALISDDLWRIITTRWTERQFQHAVAAFEKNGRTTSFAKLLR